MGFFKFIVGDYPPEYKPEIHGPYDPGRYYGKPDTPFTQVKLGDLPAWLKRRNFSPSAMLKSYYRLMWRVSNKYHQSKRFTGVHYMMVLTWFQLIYFYTNHFKDAPHVIAKYH